MGTEELGAFFTDAAMFRALLDWMAPDEPVKCIVFGASIVDSQLTDLWKSALVDGSTAEKLIDYRGSLGDFMTKADMAYCFGLITKTCFRNLQTIAEVRNLAAHDFRHSVFSTDLRDGCNKLIEPTGRLAAALRQLWPGDIPFDSDHPGQKFRRVAIAVFMDLAVLAKTQQKAEKLKGEKDLWT